MSKGLSHRAWEVRQRRVRAHLRWARDKKSYTLDVVRAGVLAFLGLGGVLLGQGASSFQYALIETVSGGFVGAGVVLVISALYKGWIISQLKRLSFTSRGVMLSHRLVGVDEVTVRLLYLAHWAGDATTNIFRGGEGSFQSALESLVRAVLGSPANDARGERYSIEEASVLITTIENNFTDFSDLVSAIWEPGGMRRETIIQEHDALSSEITLLRKCIELFARYDEHERRMIIEMAQCAQLRTGTISMIIDELELCVVRMGQDV